MTIAARAVTAPSGVSSRSRGPPCSMRMTGVFSAIGSPSPVAPISATHVAARLLRMEGQIGAVTPGAFADLIVVDGDPLADLSLLTRQGQHMPLIMKDGAFIKQERLN